MTGRMTLTQRMYQALKRQNHALVISKDKNGWWVASLGISWRVRVQGKGDTIEHALMNLFDECKRARDRSELSLADWGIQKNREDYL